jgi:hypothetical protein
MNLSKGDKDSRPATNPISKLTPVAADETSVTFKIMASIL